MEIRWTNQALEGFNNIQSKYFTSLETRDYKKALVKRIEEKIKLLGTSLPADKLKWEGSYKVLIDKYIVYYSLSNDRKICYIEYFIHSGQQR